MVLTPCKTDACCARFLYKFLVGFREGWGGGTFLLIWQRQTPNRSSLPFSLSGKGRCPTAQTYLSPYLAEADAQPLKPTFLLSGESRRPTAQTYLFSACSSSSRALLKRSGRTTMPALSLVLGQLQKKLKLAGEM